VGLLGRLKHRPPKFYNEQAGKFLGQVQLHFIHMYGPWKMERARDLANLIQEFL